MDRFSMTYGSFFAQCRPGRRMVKQKMGTVSGGADERQKIQRVRSVDAVP